MTRSLYIVGAAGTGKSTFMAELLAQLACELGPLTDLARTPNARGTIITLRGHPFAGGVYLGHMRENYPGTDGLDRASSIAGEAWLNNYQLPEIIIGEGQTLATRRFLSALCEKTDLLLLHLYAEEWVRDIRFLQRGSTQDPGFLKASETRSRNLLDDITKLGCRALSIDSAERAKWNLALAGCLAHLRGTDDAGT